MINSENDFNLIRRMLLNKPAIPEYQIASRIAKTIDVTSNEKVDNPLVEAKFSKQRKLQNNLIIHYTHEKRFQNNKTDIHKLWNRTFGQTPVMNTRLIIGARNSPNTTRELVYRRP
jgi:hypothetical protein